MAIVAVVDLDVVTTAEGLVGLGAEWERLEAQAATPYYVTHRFVTAWWDAYGPRPDHRLHVVTIRQDGRLVGVGPFALRPGRRRGRSVPTLGWASHGDYMSVLHAEGGGSASSKTVTRLVLAELTRLVEAGEVGWVDLRGIPSESSFAWDVRRSPQHHRSLAFHLENPYVDLTRARTVPSDARKRRSRLRREHDLTLAVYRGDEHGILERIAAVHRAEKEHLLRQGRAERHSLFEDPQRMALVRSIFTGTDDALTFALVEGGDPRSGRVVGYVTTFQHADRLLSWNTAYLPEFESFSLGKVLHLEILEHLDGHDPGRKLATEFDMGAGNYPWKYEWTPDLRATYRLLLRAPGGPVARRVGGPARRLARRMLGITG